MRHGAGGFGLRAAAVLLAVVMLAGLATWRVQRLLQPLWGVHTIHGDAPELAQAASLGVDVVVQVFPWRELEPTRGQFVWQWSDAFLAGAEYHGLRAVIRLDQPPDWAVKRPQGPGDPAIDAQAYAAFVSAVAARYRGRVEGYVLWNEPNLAIEWGGHPPDPAGYVALLAQGSQALRGQDPQARVVMAGLAPTNTQGDQALDDRIFLAAVLQAGGARWVDRLAFHAYGFDSPPEVEPPTPDEPLTGREGLVFRRAETLHQIAREGGAGDLPVWITEMGWPLAVPGGEEPGVDPRTQAQYLVNGLAWIQAHWPWVEQAVVWNVGGEDHPQWRVFSLVDGQGNPRPAYAALASAATRRPAGRLRGLRERVRRLSPPPDVAVALAADAVVHLGDMEMSTPWVPLYRGYVPSPVWEGVAYVRQPTGRWVLQMEVMQSNFWANRVWINGQLLDAPMPVDDFRRSWVSMAWSVPEGLLQEGANTIRVTNAHALPLIQDVGFAYDDLQLRWVRLVRAVRGSGPGWPGPDG